MTRHNNQDRESTEDFLLPKYLDKEVTEEYWKEFNNMSETERKSYLFGDWSTDSQECLHTKCKECNGTGEKTDGQTCVHYISCPCRKRTAYF